MRLAEQIANDHRNDLTIIKAQALDNGERFVRPLVIGQPSERNQVLVEHNARLVRLVRSLNRR